jgi:maltokinase
MTEPTAATPHHEPSRDEALAAFIAEARWFGGKGRDFAVSDVHELPVAEDVRVLLVSLIYPDMPSAGTGPGAIDLYQLPVSSYDEPQERLGHAHIGWWDGRHHYDAAHDREAMAVWLEAFAATEVGTSRTPDGSALTFHRVGEHDLDTAAHSTLFSGEQSNSSVAFGEDSLLKLFRRVTPGSNPDIEIHRALTEAGSTHVAALYGYAEGSVGDHTLQLAMLQQFLRTATDGWGLALASARNLFAEGDLYADEVGGDFAAEAHRLGVAVAEVHEVLAEAFPTQPLHPAETADVMRGRLEAALSVVPDLEAHRAGLEAAFDAIRGVGEQTAQRIHGDLHLGQTLRTSLGWKLVDFEGEPAKTLAERQLPDAVWRDVAGMLRSFDYAARSVARDLASSTDESGQIAYRADEWVSRNSEAFLAGYAESRGAPLTDAEHTLVAAYVADKAVYEAAYEARNRPAWLEIPLGSIERLTRSEEASRP